MEMTSDAELLAFSKDNMELVFNLESFPQRLVSILLHSKHETNQCNALLLISQYANEQNSSTLCAQMIDAVLFCVGNGSKLTRNCAVGTVSALITGKDNNALSEETNVRCFQTLVQFIQQSKDNHARHCGFAVLNLLTHIQVLRICDYSNFLLSQLNNNKDEMGKVHIVKMLFALCKQSTSNALNVISNNQFKLGLSKLVKNNRIVRYLNNQYSGKVVALQLIGVLVESQPDQFIQAWRDFVDTVLLRLVIEDNDFQAFVLLFCLVPDAKERLFTHTRLLEWLIAQSKDGDGPHVRLLVAICICNANASAALGVGGLIPVLVQCNMHADLTHWRSLLLLPKQSALLFPTRIWSNLARFWAFLCVNLKKQKKNSVRRLPQELVRCVFEML